MSKTLHLKKIFEESELDRNSVVAFCATVQNEGEHQVERQIEYFTLISSAFLWSVVL